MAAASRQPDSRLLLLGAPEQLDDPGGYVVPVVGAAHDVRQWSHDVGPVSDTIIYGRGSAGMQWPVLLLKRRKRIG
jgi:hypothetical protein